MLRMLRGVMFLVLIGIVLVAVGLLVWWLLPQATGAESAVRSAEAKAKSLATSAQADEKKITSGVNELRSRIGEHLPIASSGGTLSATAALTSVEVGTIAREAKPCVVDVTAVLSRSRTKTLESLGTGVIYSTDGLIVTNNHVLTGDGWGSPARSTLGLLQANACQPPSWAEILPTTLLFFESGPRDFKPPTLTRAPPANSRARRSWLSATTGWLASRY